MVEMLVVVALIGITVAASAIAMQGFRRRATLSAQTSTAKMFVQQARFLSIHHRVSHYVAFDTVNRTIGIYEDSGAPIGGFNDTDPRVSMTPWPEAVDLAFPPGSGTLPDPFGGSDLTNAWSLPPPDPSARWGTTMLGLMTNPRGQILSAEATPQVISTGTVVFSTKSGGAESVGIVGRAGMVRAFRFEGTAWEDN